MAHPMVDSRPDALGWLSVLLVFLIAIPSVMTVDALGAIGTPVTLIGLFGLWTWFNVRLSNRPGLASGPQPVRWVLVLFACSILVSYAAACLRLASDDELRGADRALFMVAAYAGVALLAADGFHDRARLDRFLRRLVLGGTVLASIGILQFAIGLDLTKVFNLIPLLTPNHELQLIGQRSIFRRVAGTAVHPIEFGVTLAMILPVAVAMALTDDRRTGVKRWLKVSIIAMAIPMAVARSGVLGMFVGGVVLLSGWSWRRRLNGLVFGAVGLILIRSSIPGLLGTLRNMILHYGEDPSIDSRTRAIELTGTYIREAPFFGRGFGTFSPERTQIFLDNQYLGQVIETGFVGLAVLAIVLLTPIVLCISVRKRSTHTWTREVTLALTASGFVAITTFSSFDALGFPMAANLFFLLLGCAGAVWRLSRADDQLDGLRKKTPTPSMSTSRGATSTLARNSSVARRQPLITP